jgi:hypothetical protein
MAIPVRVSKSQLEHWREQARQEQLAWYEANGALKTQRDRDAVSAGFDAGWRQAISTLKLHAGLKFPDKE